MFTNFHTFYPDTALSLLFHYRIDGFEHMLGGRFAPHVRHDPEVDQAISRQILKLRQLGVIGGSDHSVVEHLMQPRSDWFQAAEVEAPLVLVEMVTRKDELERECIAVKKAAMRMFGTPLPEATR